MERPRVALHQAGENCLSQKLEELTPLFFIRYSLQMLSCTVLPLILLSSA
jgi:hypothetical protein